MIGDQPPSYSVSRLPPSHPSVSLNAALLSRRHRSLAGSPQFTMSLIPTRIPCNASTVTSATAFSAFDFALPMDAARALSTASSASAILVDT
jgi:hypothetical protein